MTTSKKLAREVLRILHDVGEVNADGHLVLDPDAVHGRVLQLDLGTASSGHEDHGDQDQDGGDDAADPAAEGRAAGRKAREQRAKLSDLAKR